MILKIIKKIDFLVLTIIFLALVLSGSYVYLKQTKEQNNKYKNLYENLLLMQNINIKLDSFIFAQSEVKNFDKLEQNIKQFESLMKDFEEESLYQSLGEELKKHFFKVKYDFDAKKHILEKYKSKNTLTLFSLNYIIALQQKIAKNNNIEMIEDLSSDLVYLILKNYMNFSNNSDDILDKIEMLKNLNVGIEDEALNQFLKYSKFLEDSIFNLKIYKKNYQDINLVQSIKGFQEVFLTRFNDIKSIQDRIYDVIYLLSSILTIMIIIGYIKSLSLKDELASFKYAVENSDDSIVVTDKERRITYVNDAFCKASGYSKEEAFGKNPNILKSGKMSEEFYKNMNKTLDEGKKWSGEFINKDKFGNIYYEQASITPMFRNGVLKGYLAIKLNITDYVRQKREVEFLALHDSLTKLPNRRYMRQELESLLGDDNYDVDLMFLDLDGFKVVNDSLGHNVGDILLKKVALKLNNLIKDKGLVFRTGGDEFAVILTYKQTKSISAQLAKKIVNEINKKFTIEKHRIKIGVSIGISKYNKDKDDINSLLRHADIAMYESKLKGKNRFKYYTKSLSHRLQKKIITQNLLQSAIHKNEMYVVYQPKYELRSKKVTAYETLIRWESNELGLVSPAYFIPIAENMKIINDISLFVFTRACLDFKKLKESNKDLQSISVNLSTAQLLNKNLFDEFTTIVNELGIEPKNIALEITETNIMKNIEKSSEMLQKMREFGFEIELDDFGTGYSSMSYIKKLPISRIKIDKSFVDDILEDRSDIKIIEAMVLMAKSFDYETIAEGIETREQEEVLKDLGVDFGQGFYFSKPKRIEELI
jgi:diguanylate cyclase (GGDEF)-like protein/PAS domain S-box-containing protein